MPTEIALEILYANTSFPIKGNPAYTLRFSWKCTHCGEMNQDDTATECSHSKSKRIM